MGRITIAGKGEEPSPPSSSKTSSLLFSSTSPSTNFPFFSSSRMTTITESNISPPMTSQSSTLPYRQSNDIPLRESIIHEDKTILDEQHDKNDTNINLQSPTHQRRLPLPNKLTFEQNITNLIENESPLLQSELLTAEHELSVLRSRLAVNEGVTAVTGTILKSLKGQFEPHHTVDTATSPFDISKLNLFQHSLAIQTSPMIETLPDIPESVEIHYDAQTVKSPYLLVKAKNSFWIAQPIPVAEAQSHLKKFSSPVMKRATVKLPRTFDQTFLTDSDTDDEQIITSQSMEDKQLNKPINIDNTISNEVTSSTIIEESISPSNENLLSSTDKFSSVLTENKLENEIPMEDKQPTSDVKEPILEIKKIRSSSLLRVEEQFEQFDDKIDEIYSIIDYLKNTKLTSTNFNTIHTKINDLKTIISDINLNKQDELRIEYELDELQNLFHTINDNLINQLHQQEDYSLIDLFEQNVNELRRIINDIKSKQTNLTTTKINESEIKSDENLQENLSKQMIPHDADWSPEQMAEYFQRGPDGELLLSKQAHSHLIPESPVITRDVFFEGDKSIQEKRSSHPHVTHLIPEDARVSADSFYEGDVHRSLYHKEKAKETMVHDKHLIPESPRVSSDVFYEGDSQRSMFVERSSLPQMESIQPSSIDNLRSIMSDLMLAASWSKKSYKIDEQQIKHNDEEILAESFITTEQHYPPSKLCEIVHEIENFPLTLPTQKLDESTIEVEELDTRSPFTSQSPIFIHRTILTRQDTERWPQDETIIIDEQAQEDILKTTELEKITEDIRQHAENSLNLLKEKEEIYEKRYQLPQIIDQQIIIDDNLYDKSKKHIEERKDNIFIETPQEEIEERDENDQYHIEKTWSTDKIIEPSSIIPTDEDVQALHKPLDEYQQEQQQKSELRASAQADQYEYQLESKLASEQLPTDLTRLIENEEQLSSPIHTPIEEKHELQRRLSSEKHSTESPHLSEQEEEQYEPKYETFEQDRHEPLLTFQQHFIEHPELDIQQKDEQADYYENEKILTTDTTIIKPLETAEKQEKRHDEETVKLEREAGEIYEAEEFETQQKRTSPEIHRESSHESGHEEEEETEQYQPQRKLSDDKIVLESSPVIEEPQHEPSSTSAAIPTTFQQEIHEKYEPREDYHIKQKLTTEQIIAESPELSEHEHEEDQYEPESITSSEKIQIEPSETIEVDHHEALLSSDREFVEFPELRTSYTDEHVVEYRETVKEEEKTPHDEELLETQKPVSEIHEIHDYEIEQKPTRADIHIESPHESDHEEEEEEEQYEPQRKPSDEQVVLESPPVTEEAQYKASSILTAVPIAFHQEAHEVKQEPEEDYQTQRKLSTEHVIVESPEISEHEQEEDQYEPELRTSSDRIQIEPAVTIEKEREETLLAPTQQIIEPTELITTHRDEEKDYYESEEELISDNIVVEPPKIVEEEEKHHDEELLELEKEAGETHEAEEYETEQKPTATDIHIESPHESDHEEEEKEEQYQSQRKPTDESVVLETSPTTEEAQYEPSSTFAAVPIAFQQEIYEVKHEPEEYYQIERKLSTEQIIVESPQLSEHEQEEEEYEPKSITSSDKIHIEPRETVEQDRQTSLDTSYTDKKEDHYEFEDKLTRDKNVFESSEIVEEERLHKKEPSEQEKGAGEISEPIESEIEEKISGADIHLESSHESDHEEEQVRPDRKRSTDQIIVESEEVQKDQYERASSFEQIPSAFYEEIHEMKQEPREDYPIERKLSTEQIITGSTEVSEHEEEEEQYEPESITSSEEIKVEEDRHEPLSTGAQQFIEPAALVAPHIGEQKDEYESEEELSVDKNVIEAPETVEEEEKHHDEESLELEKETGKTHDIDEHAIQQQPTAADIHIESPHESDHEEEEEEEQYQPQRKSSDEQVVLEISPITEEAQYKASSILAAAPIAFHQGVHEVKQGPEEDYQIERKLSSEQVIVESPEVSEREQEEEKYEPESITTSEEIKTELSGTVEQDFYEPLLASAQQLIEPAQQVTGHRDEEEDYYETEEELTSDQNVIESAEIVGQEKRHDEELLETEKTTGEIYETGEYEIEQKSTDANISLESPHESDHEEEQEQRLSERIRSTDEVIVETPEIVEHEKSPFEQFHHDEQINIIPRDEMEREESEPIDHQESHERLCSQKTELEFLQFSEPEEDEDEFQQSQLDRRAYIISSQETRPTEIEVEEQYPSERKLSSEKIAIESAQIIEHDQEEKAYERPLTSEQISDEEKEVHKRKLSVEKRSTESPDLSEHEEDQYEQKFETESISSSEKIKIEPTETVEQQRQEPLLISQQQFIEHPELRIQHKDEETLETEKEAGEVHEENEYEIEQKSTGTDIHVDSPHESDHKQEKRQYESSSGFEGFPIAFPQKSEEIKQESEEDYQIEQNLSTEHDVTGFSELSEHEEDEYQYEQRYETGQYQSPSITSPDKMDIESVEITEHDHSEPLQTSAQQFIEPPEIDTQQKDEQKLTTDEIVIESPEKVEEEMKHDDQETLEFQTEVGGIHKEDKYEVERKLRDENIHLESPHESDHEEEQVQPERKRSADHIVVEPVEKLEQDQYAPTLSLEHVLHQYHQVIQNEEQALEEINEMQRMLTSVQRMTGSPEQSKQKQQADQYEPESLSSSQKIHIEPTKTVEEDRSKPLLTTQQQFIEQPEAGIQHEDEEQEHDKESSVHEKAAGETSEVDKYEIEQKSTRSDIHLQLPHEGYHEEEQVQPERKFRADQGVVEPSQESEEEDQYKPTLSLEHVLNQYHQVIEKEEQDLEEINEVQRVLTAVQAIVGSVEPIEQKQTEDQYKPELRISSDYIQIERGVPVEKEREEPLLSSQPRFLELLEAETSPTDEEKDHYESEEELNSDNMVVESPKTVEQQKRHHGEESWELEKETGETHETEEYETEHKPTATAIHIESPHESDHEEEEEEEQYESQRKSSDEQVVLESSPVTEEAQYKVSSILAAAPIAFHQDTHEVKHEPEEDYRIERKLSTEQVVVESPALSEHEQEEESITSSDKIHIEPRETVEQDRQESLGTSYADRKEDHDEPEEKLFTDEKVVEYRETVKEEEKTPHDEEVLETQKPVSETHEIHDYEIEQKPIRADIHIESPHESEHEEEEEEESYQSEQKRSADQFVIESEEQLEEDQYKGPSSFEQAPSTFRQEIEEEKQESERSSSFEKDIVESPELTEREEQYQPEFLITSNIMKTEAAETVKQDHQLIEHPEIETQHIHEQEDHLESEKKLAVDKNAIEYPEIVEEERRHHDKELFEPEKTTGEIYEVHDYETEQKPSGADIYIESPHESDHEEEEEEVQPERKLSIDEFVVEPSEEEQYERTSSFEQVDVGFHQDIDKEKHDIHDDYEQEQKLASAIISSEPPQISEYEPFETIDYKQYQHEIPRTDEENQTEVENIFKSERKLSSGKISLESSQSDEHAEESQKSQEEPLTSEIHDAESAHAIEHYEGKFDTDQYSEKSDQQEEDIIIEVPQKIEDQDTESKSFVSSEYENVEQSHHDKIMTEPSEKIEEKHDDQSIQKLSSVKFIVASAPSSEEEEREGYEYGREFHIESTPKFDEEIDDEYFLKMLEAKYSNQQDISSEQKIKTDEIIIQSPDVSEHEEQHEPIPSEFDQEIKEEKAERKSSADQIITESFPLIEKEKDENILESSQTIDKEPIEKQITDEIIFQSLETIKQQNIEYERPLSSGLVTLTFPQQYDDDTYKLKSQYEFEPSSSAGKSTIESLQENEQDNEIITETSPTLEYPYESSPSFKREIIDDNFTNLESSSFHKEQDDDNDEIEHHQLKRPQQWTQSPFQRDEIYGDKYRPTKYSIESPETELQQSSNYKEQHVEVESPITSHIQRSSVISRTIPAYSDEEELEEQEENDFRPTHLDISIPDEDLLKTSTSDEQIYEENNQYENVLIQTSNDIVDQILNDAIRETTEQDLNYSLYQTAKDIVHDVIDNVQKKYDDDIVSSQIEEATSADVSISDITDWSALVKTTPDITNQEKPTQRTDSSSDHEEGKQQQEESPKDEYTISDEDDVEEKNKLVPTTMDLPYLSVSDVVTSKSTQELGNLVQELQTLEQQINENIDLHHSLSTSSSSSSSSTSSISENDEIHHYDLNNAQITKTTSTNELTNLIAELQTIEEQLEDKLDSKLEQKPDIPVSSESIHELGSLMNELNDVTEQLQERLQQEQTVQSTNIDQLSHDIIKYRRDSQTNASEKYSHRTERRPSSPPTSPLYKHEFVHVTCQSMSDVDQVQEQLRHEHEENAILKDMINTIINQAQQNIQSGLPEVSQSALKAVPTLVINQRRMPYIQSSATSISDELDFSHDDSTGDKTSELAAQLDYLRRMSRYENLLDEQHHIEIVSNETNRRMHEDTIIHITPDDDENEIMSTNYLTIVREEQQALDEYDEDHDEDKDKEKKKKTKRKCSEDDDKSLSEHHDSDDDDDHDHDYKDNKPSIPLHTIETIQSESNQQSTPTESNQKQSQQHQQQQKEQMEMSRDSINELMIMSQDSLKQRSSDSLDAEQELKYLLSNPNTSTISTNETDDFMYKQHTNEPTPSRMMMKYDEDDTNDIRSTTKQYSLISNEIEIGQLPVIHARRTASENSLFSTSSSSIHMYDSHSLSASCLVDKDDLTPSNDYIDYQQTVFYDDSQKNQQIYRETTTTDDDNQYNNLNTNITSSPTTGIGFFDRVKAFVTKPVEIVQEAMENRRKQRSTSSLSSNADLNDKQILDNEQNLSSSPSSQQQQQQQQHFHSAYDLYDEEKLKLVRSPELYDMDNVNSFNQKVLLTNLQAQNRTQSESALVIDDLKHHSIETASNEASEEFLPTISKDNSLEFIQQQQQQQRHSTPFDDVMEKESSSEHSESYNIPTSAFSDAFEPTSSCQRPLALTLPGQQPSSPPLPQQQQQQQTIEESMTEEEFDTLAADYVHQVLNDVVAQMIGEHDDSLSNKSDKLVGNDTSSDDDEDELVEAEDEEQNQNPIPTDTSSFSVNDRYSADESSNTREQSADEETSARSSTTATPTKTSCHKNIYTEDLIDEQTPIILKSPPIVSHGSQSDTGTYFSIVSPSSGDYVDAYSTHSTIDDDKLGLQYHTQSNSSQYLTANDETPNLLTSDDNEYINERGKINYAYNDSSSDDNYSNKNRQENFIITNEKISEEKYSGEGEESSSGNQTYVQQRRKRSNEQRSSLLNDLTTNTSESTTTIIPQPTTKSVSFKLDLNENFQRSPRLSTSSGTTIPRQESLDSPLNDSNDKSIIKILQDEILRSNLETIKNDLELNYPYDREIYPSTSTPTTIQPTKKTLSSSEYDAGSESDQDSILVDSIKTTIQEKLNDIYHDKESFIDRIKLKFERSLDRLVEKTLAGEVNTSKSDIISPFTDQSLDRSLPTIAQPSTMIHAHSEQLLQACPDELDYGTLQRFSSDSCIIIHVPEQYTPSSTLFFDQLKTDQIEKKSSSNQQTSAFSYYTKQDHQQPSSSPIEMLNPTNELIENISPINRYTPRSLDDSSVELGERDMTDMSDEFVLVKNLSPLTNTKDIKNDTPSNTSSSSSEKHESPDLIDILQHQCDYPPLDTGFDLRSGTTLETVYESPELRQDEIKSAISTLSLTTTDNNRPYSTENNSSNTPNTDDSLMEFERIEMELLKNTSTTNIIDIVREIRSSVDSLTQQQHDDNNKVESFIEKHYPTIQNDVENVLNDILDMTSDLTHSISSQSDATTVIYKSQHHSFDDDYVEITHDDIKNQERNLFSSDEDILHNQTTLSSHDKRRLSAPNNENISRRLKTPSSSSSSSSSFSSTSRSVIYSQQHSHPSYQQQRLLQAETDLASFKQHQQTQSATDLPFLPPFVNTNPIKRKKQSSSVSSTPTLFPTEITSGDSKKKTHSHPGSLGGSQVPPRSSLIKEEITSSPITSVSPHSSSSHHSDDCFCTDPTTTTSHQH
ncbi:unnamed protein product [Rotaria sp. Silwood1]|nr:unnamed protein product [Rotaria sp. Silwood1]